MLTNWLQCELLGNLKISSSWFRWNLISFCTRAWEVVIKHHLTSPYFLAWHSEHNLLLIWVINHLDREESMNEKYFPSLRVSSEKRTVEKSTARRIKVSCCSWLSCNFSCPHFSLILKHQTWDQVSSKKMTNFTFFMDAKIDEWKCFWLSLTVIIISAMTFILRAICAKWFFRMGL